MSIHSIDWEAIDWVPVRPGIERKAFSGNGATLALHRLQPGHELKPHSHPHEQIVYILEGLVDFHIGDEVVRLGAGGLAHIPGEVVHYVEVVGDGPALNLDVFTPARPEYG
ncbi:cupin domain-containing protein [Mesorhizobium humile]|uniref:Cupin domain-containing protein n=1 Tax=Mesorhizobium humile TaxID=3072313 RepID=A0ABU4YFL7_9HYPH|nr:MULTISPECIES: cupin domain-containing protein [unclassified Mesorhizobium]MDX8458860.1 cupin domain-containing protein [Mesorhizobium sp. VK2D]MDX8484642.1 cupin domain-containing protein [Mesorhizobium sp. VK2B]